MPRHNLPDIVHQNDFNKANHLFCYTRNEKLRFKQEKIFDDGKQFTEYLRSIAPCIHGLKNKIFVVACDGSLFNCRDNLNQLAHDISILNALGLQIVLIYGASPQVEKQLELHKLQPKCIDGIRVIDCKMAEAAKEAIGRIRFDIEAAFSQRLPDTPMANSNIVITSGNFVTARPLGILNGIDYQYTGVVSKIDKRSISNLLNNQKIVLISSIGFSVTGEAFNLSMTDVASSVAIALSADKLIYIDTFLENKELLQKEMYVDEAEEFLKKAKNIGINLLNYIKTAIYSCRNQVHSTHVIPFNIDGAILTELFNRNLAGITIKANSFENLREANLNDINNIIKLIEPLEKNGTLVQRDRTQLKRDIFNFSVIEDNKILLGCAALFPYISEQVGEMACLTVCPEAQGSGNGERLLKQIEKRARNLGLKKIFVLTVRTEHWFLKRGFTKTSIDSLPDDRRKLYNWQRRSLVLIKNI